MYFFLHSSPAHARLLGRNVDGPAPLITPSLFSPRRPCFARSNPGVNCDKGPSNGPAPQSSLRSKSLSLISSFLASSCRQPSCYHYLIVSLSTTRAAVPPDNKPVPRPATPTALNQIHLRSEPFCSSQHSRTNYHLHGESLAERRLDAAARGMESKETDRICISDRRDRSEYLRSTEAGTEEGQRNLTTRWVLTMWSLTTETRC